MPLLGDVMGWIPLKGLVMVKRSANPKTCNDVECDLVWYENKIETIVQIHLLNFLGENRFEGV